MKYRVKFSLVLAFFFAVIGSSAGANNGMKNLINNYENWQFFTDQVMGGVSSGKLALSNEGANKFLRMTGVVSTENNGGFIQFRSSVSGLNNEVSGVSLRVRGNGEKYYVFLRTTGTILPWQYYSAEFISGTDWQDIKLPISDFSKSNFLLRKKISPESIRSVGVVAFGKNYDALVEVSAIAFY